MKIIVRYHLASGRIIEEAPKDLPRDLSLAEMERHLAALLLDPKTGRMIPMVSVTSHSGVRSLINMEHLERISLEEEDLL